MNMTEHKGRRKRRRERGRRRRKGEIEEEIL